MIPFLNEQERLRLDERIADVEKQTGAQIVLAVIERSDAYPELPWKAFALGAAMAGSAACVLNLLQPEGITVATVFFAVIAALATGGAFALLTVFLPKGARLFLDAHRADMEVHQHAEALFLSREIFATRNRTGILLLVSLFERRVVILPDKGLHECLGQDVLREIIARMTVPLAAGPAYGALEAGLAGLEQALSASTACRSGTNELPDAIIQEKGA